MDERRPRRRSSEVEAAIRAAALAELAENGYEGVTFERVARRAQTSKPVVYRRYASRADLVMDAMVADDRSISRPKPTGSLRGDLLRWLSKVGPRSAWLGPETFRALMGEGGAESLRAAADLAVAKISIIDKAIITPARERGELGPLPLHPGVIATPFLLTRDRVTFAPWAPLEVTDIVDRVAIPLYRAESGLGPLTAS